MEKKIQFVSKYSLFLALGQRISLPVFGFVSFFILIRELTSVQMGTWALFVTITTVIEVAKNGLVKPALVKYINSSFSQSIKAQSASVLINFIYTSIVFVLITINYIFFDFFFEVSEIKLLFFVYVPNLFLLIPFSHFEFVQQANSKFLGIFWSYFSRQFIFFAFVIFLFVFNIEIRLYTLVLSQGIGIFIGAIISYFFAKKYISNAFVLEKAWILKLWNYGKFVLLSNLSSNLFRSTDHLMVASLVSLPAVALYSLCNRIVNLLDIPSTAIGDVIFPKSVQLYNEKGKKGIKEIYEKAVGYTLSFMIPISLIIYFLSDFIVLLIGGEEYLEASNILKVSTFYIIFLPFMKQFGTVINAIGKPKLNFNLIVILATVNLLSNYILITYIGLLGAVYGTLIAYLVGFIFINIVLKNEIGISIIKILKHSTMFYPMAFKHIRLKYI